MTKKLKRISFEVTGQCNLKCSYCCRSYLNNSKKISTEISTPEILKIINDARGLGCNSFLFTGGEAFLKKDFDKILNSCSGCFVEIFSNGTLITEPKNKILIKKYLSRLTITLDGLNSHNYYRIGSDYNQILRNIKEIKKYAPEVKIKINTLLNNKSIRDLLELYELLKNAAVDEWHIDFPQLRGRLAELEDNFSADYDQIAEVLKNLLKLFYEDNQPFYLKIYKIFSSKITKNNFIIADLEENPCAYKIDRSMFINAEGDYILCPSIPSQDISFANTNQNTLFEAISLAKNSDFKKIRFKDLKECLKCRYFDLCQGGCRGEAKILSNSFTSPDLNACSLMIISEKIIYPSLPDEIRQIYLDKINKKGEFPRKISKLDELKDRHQLKYSKSKIDYENN